MTLSTGNRLRFIYCTSYCFGFASKFLKVKEGTEEKNKHIVYLSNAIKQDKDREGERISIIEMD